MKEWNRLRNYVIDCTCNTSYSLIFTEMVQLWAHDCTMIGSIKVWHQFLCKLMRELTRDKLILVANAFNLDSMSRPCVQSSVQSYKSSSEAKFCNWCDMSLWAAGDTELIEQPPWLLPPAGRCRMKPPLGCTPHDGNGCTTPALLAFCTA